jgi:3-dehydroquinate synthetase
VIALTAFGAVSRRYHAIVGSNLLETLGSRIPKKLRRSRVAIISDSNVGPLFANRAKRSLTSAGFNPTLITIPAGEKSKTLRQAGAICEQMIAAGLDRQSFVIGLGPSIRMQLSVTSVV